LLVLGNGQPIVVIKQGEIFSRQSVAGIATRAVYQLGGSEGLAPNDTILITLTGGAVWSSTRPTLTPSAGSLGNGLSATLPLSGGNPGENTALWRVVDNNVTGGTTFTLNSDAAIYDLSALYSPVDLQMSVSTATGIPVGQPNQSLNAQLQSGPSAGDALQFNFVNLTTSAATIDTPATDIAQVTEKYRLFEKNALTTKTTGFTITSNATGSGIPAANIDSGRLVFTISGDFNGIESVSGSTITGSDSTGNQEGGTYGQFTIDRSIGKAWGSNTSPIAPGASQTNLITMFADGVTEQGDRSFTLEVEVSDTGFDFLAHTVIPKTTINTIASNGTFFSTNTFGPQNYIKVTDSSGSATTSGGDIIIMAFDGNGAEVLPVAGAPLLPTAIGSDATVIIAGADLLANFPDAVRIDFLVNTLSATVSNVKKTDSGANVNVFSNGRGGSL